MASLAQWLQKIGLAEHERTFVENDIDLDVIGTLSDADLKELGLTLGQRKRLLQALAQTSEASAPAAPLHSTSARNSTACLVNKWVSLTSA